jgi:hypothetical protein
MKTIEELKAFCEGFARNLSAEDVACADYWVIWGGYDINFVGADFSDRVKEGEMLCDAYRAGWVDDIGAPVHTFIVKGESK